MDETSVSKSEPRVPKIFFCRRRKDDVVAKMLYIALPMGWQSWVDELVPGLGKPIREKVLKGIAECTHVIVIWTEDTSSNAWVNQEVGAALQKDIPVLPLIQQGVCLKAMLEGIEGSYYDPNDPLNGVKEFVRKLQDQLTRDGYQLLDLANVDQRLERFWKTYQGEIENNGFTSVP